MCPFWGAMTMYLFLDFSQACMATGNLRLGREKSEGLVSVEDGFQQDRDLAPRAGVRAPLLQ